MLPQAMKEYRKRHRLAQSDLASYLRVDQSSVAYWEAGRVKPGGPALILLEMLLALDAHPALVICTNISTKDKAKAFREPFDNKLDF